MHKQNHLSVAIKQSLHCLSNIHWMQRECWTLHCGKCFLNICCMFANCAPKNFEIQTIYKYMRSLGTQFLVIFASKMCACTKMGKMQAKKMSCILHYKWQHPLNAESAAQIFAQSAPKWQHDFNELLMLHRFKLNAMCYNQCARQAAMFQLIELQKDIDLLSDHNDNSKRWVDNAQT